jgi:hypothetical protein
VPDEIAALDNGQLPAGMASLSPEQFGLLDTADPAYLRMDGPGAAEEFDANPLVGQLRLTAEDQLHIISDDLITILFAPTRPSPS